MKRILIPTDFSDNAKDALAYALEFVADETSQLEIVHVIEPLLITVADTTIVDNKAMETLRGQAETAMEALKLFSGQYFESEGIKNVTLETKVIIGSVIDTIKKTADVDKADLIIMGTQGSNHNLLEKVLGTISTKILNNAPCPIILVPKDYDYEKIDNIIYSTNLDHSDPYELSQALKSLEPHTPLVRVLYVRRPVEDNYNTSIEVFAKYMVDHSPSVRTIFDVEVGSDVEIALSAHALKHGAEMIIMHKSKKTFLERIFRVSHTKSMTNRLSVPLMVIN